MKKTLAFMAAILMMCTSASAQKSTERLTYKDILEGRVVPQTEMSETYVRGDKLKSMRLDTFHCVRFDTDADRLATLETIIRQTAAESTGAEMNTEGGLLTYAFITFPESLFGKRKYLGYQVKDAGGSYSVTLLYITGNATKAELKTIFK